MKVINLKRTFVIKTIVQCTEKGRREKKKRGNGLVMLDMSWPWWSLEESVDSVFVVTRIFLYTRKLIVLTSPH